MGSWSWIFKCHQLITDIFRAKAVDTELQLMDIADQFNCEEIIIGRGDRLVVGTAEYRSV